MSGLIDPTTTLLTHALDGLTDRQSVISANLANIDTPGYQPKALDFETALQTEFASMGGTSPADFALPPSAGVAANVALETTDRRHIRSISSSGGSSTTAATAVNENMRNDGNKVDLETEMTALSESQIQYEADSRLIAGKFAQLHSVLGG
jgi:flagellar basal-body rod protein FlgB